MHITFSHIRNGDKKNTQSKLYIEANTNKKKTFFQETWVSHKTD